MNASRQRVSLTTGFATCLLSWLLGCPPCSADEPAQPPAAQPPPRPSASRPLCDYKSKHLQVRTDLAQDEADALFARLEQTLLFAARYWGREPRGQIECFVVEDLANWEDTELPHRLARIIVFGVGGATVPRVVGTGKRSRNTPAVFASSRPGIAEHEIIHAYCAQTFGTGGPEWYKEGMAEMVSRGSTRAAGIQCPGDQIVSLRTGKRSSVHEIFGVGDTRKQLAAALKSMMEDPAHRGRHVSLEAWSQRDTDNVAQARDEYMRSWALCYMLLHNPNYSQRFRTMGSLALDTNQPSAFTAFFDPVQGEIAFEYKFLLDNMAAGYRVDLCRWDWQTRFQPLAAGCSHRTRVAAARGFQASGLEVAAGQRYSFQADGRWSTMTGGQDTDADGGADNSGRLVGVVMNAFDLGTPFLLGTRSSFVAPTNGRLYLRCNDPWHELGDNDGQIVVSFRAP